MSASPAAAESYRARVELLLAELALERGIDELAQLVDVSPQRLAALVDDGELSDEETRWLGPRLRRVVDSRHKKPASADSLANALPPTAAEILRSPAFSKPRRTYPTTIAALDDKIAGGFKSRQLVVIAAPTGKGKTGLVGTLMLLLARAGHAVLWVTTELEDAEQAARFAAIALRCSSGTNVTPDDFLSQQLPAEHGARELEGLPLYLVNLDDPDGDPFVAIAAHAAAIRQHRGAAPIVVIDYLQVLAVEDEEQRRMSVTKVATRSRRLARELDAPVVAISSVSRAYYGPGRAKKKSEEPEDPRDWLAAAKESGDVEYAAAVFAYLDTGKETSAEGDTPARLIIAKSRQGDVGFVGLRFHGPSGAFVASDEALARFAQAAPAARGPSDTARVLQELRKRRLDPPTRETLRVSVPGLGVSKVDAALKSLLADGAVEMQEREYQNKRKQTRTRQVVVLVEAEPEVPDAE